MVSKQQEVVDRLRSLDRSTRLKAVREIKNQIIGNKNKKLSYIKLEAVPRVVELLQQTEDTSLLIQSAAAVGSFAYKLEDGMRAVVTSGGVQQLLLALSSKEEQVVQAALRALKLVWQSASELSPVDDAALQRLISLSAAADSQIAESAAQVLAYFSSLADADTQEKLAQEPSAVKALMHLALSDSVDRSIALVTLCEQMQTSSKAVVQCVAHPNWYHGLLSLLKTKSPSDNLATCMCLQTICAAKEAAQISSQTVEALQRAMLPVLLKLLHLPSVPSQVPCVLQELLQQNHAMQRAANDMDAISSLTTLMHHEQIWQTSPQFKAGMLRAIAVLCENDGNARWKFMERACVTQVAKALLDTDVQVCSAACACIRSLSCSMKCLRSLELPCLTPAVVGLLSSPDREVQLTALEALANLVLDTASVKDRVVQSGGLTAVVKMLGSPEEEVRCSAIWMLANMMHEASEDVAKAVMAALPWDQVSQLLQDQDMSVQDKAFLFMRNLAAGKAAAEGAKKWSQGAALPALVARLHNLQPPQPHLVDTLYCLSNFAATGSEEDRDAIASVAAECIKAHLHNEGVDVRTAALWVILNLTEGADSDSDSPQGPVKRIQQFQSVGTEARLRDMLQDMSLDVRERVSTALNNFGCAPDTSLDF